MGSDFSLTYNYKSKVATCLVLCYLVHILRGKKSCPTLTGRQDGLHEKL